MGYTDDSPALPTARVFVQRFAPYLSSTLYGLIPAPVENLQEIANGPMGVTEQMVLLYDPEWVKAEDPHVVATGLAHECFHVQLLHVKRGLKYADTATFFIACDLFINGVMVEQKRSVRVKEGANTTIQQVPLWKFPDWALMPEQYGWPNGLTSDEYYQRLKKLEQQGKKSAKSKDGEGEEGKGGKQNATAGKDGDGTKEKGSGHVKPANKIMAGCCGGMTSSPISKVQEALQNAEKQGRSEAAVLEKIKQTAQAIKEHLQSLGRGNAAGAWSELVQMSDETFEVPWDVLLSNVLSQTMEQIKVGGSDYSMRRLSKRSYAVGFPRPGLVDYDPILWLVVDSSGSMGAKQLGVALKVCADVIQQTGLTQVYYLDADARVQREPMPVTAQDLYQMEILGRGGTDFRPAIEKAKKAIPRPDALVYLTDGDGTAPTDAPEYMEVIWVVVPTSKTKPAAWGQTVYLK